MTTNQSVPTRSATAVRRDKRPRRRVTTALLWLRIALVAVLAALANTYGAWYGTWILGLLGGIAVPNRAAASAALAGVLGWGIPLMVTPLLLRAANVVVDVMGIGPSGTLLLALTIVWGGLLCACGAWAGAALRRLWTP